MLNEAASLLSLLPCLMIFSSYTLPPAVLSVWGPSQTSLCFLHTVRQSWVLANWPAVLQWWRGQMWLSSRHRFVLFATGQLTDLEKLIYLAPVSHFQTGGLSQSGLFYLTWSSQALSIVLPMTYIHPSLWLMDCSLCMYHILFINPSADGHVGSLQMISLL